MKKLKEIEVWCIENEEDRIVQEVKLGFERWEQKGEQKGEQKERVEIALADVGGRGEHRACLPDDGSQTPHSDHSEEGRKW